MSRRYPSRPIAGVLAAVRRDGRCLLLRRAAHAGSGKWGFPGGELELGETFAECARRELAEETGVEAVARGTLTALDYVERDGEGRVLYHFALITVLLDWVSGEGELLEPEVHSEIGWLTPEEVLERRLPASPHAVELMRMAIAAGPEDAWAPGA